jgi:hypothetical protein
VVTRQGPEGATDRNDPVTYRRYVKRLLERCRQTRDPVVITNLLFWGPLLSEEGGDPKECLRLIDRCLEKTRSQPTDSGMLMVKGMAEYRAGHHEVAVKWLGKAEPLVTARRKAGIQFFLSMACQRLNQPDQARAAYRQGLGYLTKEFGSPDRFTFRESIWYYWPWCQILRREAEALLNNAKGPDKPKE